MLLYIIIMQINGNRYVEEGGQIKELMNKRRRRMDVIGVEEQEKKGDEDECGQWTQV